MNLEKKIVALSILALTIGIATILPLAYIPYQMSATAQEEPFFEPNINYIVTIPDIKTLNGGNPYETIVYPDGSTQQHKIANTARINLAMCYDITPNGFNLKDADAKIEVYNFHIYSDQKSLANVTQSVAITGNVSDPSVPNGVTTAITEWSSDKNTYTFADGTIYDMTGVIGPVSATSVGFTDLHWISVAKGHFNFGGGIDFCESTTTYESAHILKDTQALNDLRSAQTIYIDITRVLQATYKQSNNQLFASTIMATQTSKEVLQHIVLDMTELDNMGRVLYEGEHEGYIPQGNELRETYTPLFSDIQLITRLLTTKNIRYN